MKGSYLWSRTSFDTRHILILNSVVYTINLVQVQAVTFLVKPTKFCGYKHVAVLVDIC